MATVFDENIDRASGVCEPCAGVRSALGGAHCDNDASAVSQLTEPVGLACADPQWVGDECVAGAVVDECLDFPRGGRQARARVGYVWASQAACASSRVGTQDDP